MASQRCRPGAKLHHPLLHRIQQWDSRGNRVGSRHDAAVTRWCAAPLPRASRGHQTSRVRTVAHGWGLPRGRQLDQQGACSDAGTEGGQQQEEGVVSSPVGLTSEAGGTCELEAFAGWSTKELSVCHQPQGKSGGSWAAVQVTESRTTKGGRCGSLRRRLGNTACMQRNRKCS